MSIALTAPAPNWTESRLQQEAVMWFNKHYRDLSDLLFHIPNGGFRNAREAARLKAQGVKAGVPDLMLARPNGLFSARTYHGLFIEMKTSTGTLDKHQASYHAQLQAQGYRVEVIRSLADFQALITEYLA